jgi:hypothetical protein
LMAIITSNPDCWLDGVPAAGGSVNGDLYP